MRAAAEDSERAGPGSGWSGSKGEAGSIKEARPRRRRRERTDLRRKPRRERAVRKSLGRSTSVYPAGNPIFEILEELFWLSCGWGVCFFFLFSNNSNFFQSDFFFLLHLQSNLNNFSIIFNQSSKQFINGVR